MSFGAHAVSVVTRLRIAVKSWTFPGSGAYWEGRYRSAGNSGAGSYGEQADRKARFLNEFIVQENIRSVVEFGCGDGNQLSLAAYPRYLGLDVSPTAIASCVRRFKSDRAKSFALYRPDAFEDPAGFFRADLALSLDVIYHLIEDDVYDRYMRHLFGSATRFVVIYATNEEHRRQAAHVRHRQFDAWVSTQTDWALKRIETRPKPEHQDFYVYHRPIG
jgi:SAM-dependent methyltransferase